MFFQSDRPLSVGYSDSFRLGFEADAEAVSTFGKRRTFDICFYVQLLVSKRLDEHFD